jgi:hypothetical protein
VRFGAKNALLVRRRPSGATCRPRTRDRSKMILASRNVSLACLYGASRDVCQRIKRILEVERGITYTSFIPRNCFVNLYVNLYVKI